MSDEKPASFADLREALPPKEGVFVDEFLIDLDASKAARRAGYSGRSAYQRGYVLKNTPAVAAAIAAGLAEQSARTNNTADRVIAELMRSAYADPRDLLDATGRYLPLHKMPADMRRAIASIDVEHKNKSTRIVRIRMTDKTRSLELLGRRLKMFSERLELDASDGLSSLIKQAFGRPATPVSDIKKSEPQA